MGKCICDSNDPIARKLERFWEPFSRQLRFDETGKSKKETFRKYAVSFRNRPLRSLAYTSPSFFFPLPLPGTNLLKNVLTLWQPLGPRLRGRSFRCVLH